MLNKRRITDMLMTVLLPMLMGYALVGEAAHEWLGMVMLLLFLIHHILNRKWIKNIARGRYSPQRTAFLVIDLFLAVIMIALPVSGVILSKHIFSSLQIGVNTSVMRNIHLLCSYWGFVLMSLHIGFHWKDMLSMAEKHIKMRSDIYKRLARVLVLLISIYGVYAFWKRNLVDYMFLQNQFVFLDFNEPLLFFLLDYIMIIVLLALVGHYIMAGMQYITQRRK